MPIKNINDLDTLAVSNNGKIIHMSIITSGHLDSSSTTQELVLDKIQNYLCYINSEEFLNKFGKLNPQNVIIKLICTDEPDPLIKELFKKIIPWVEENNARIEMIVK